ncbi:MAG TPA: SpoIID/LytB domain-containing protein, partial [Candidatus Acidoferrales bacterium]|nr:SpoIID/LytB domain-containing protein [Candidatus Acidoferrales bacterium]
MRRDNFLLLTTAALLSPRAAHAQNDVDPALSSSRPGLRVLLGRGDAQPGSGQTFTFNGAAYRGTFERLDDGQIVDVVDIEKYLYSVVPREMPSSWGQAALQAQSICARTYVLQRSDPRRAYDLVPSELDQVYHGISGETPAGAAAVDSTRGQVLWYAHGYAQIAYSSCCGGHTESSADAWGNVGFPYLQGVVCTWCSDSPHYRWTTNLSLDEIASRLSTSLQPGARLNDVQIADRDSSGRARSFDLVTDRANISVSGSSFRRAVGTRVLPSLLVTSMTRGRDGVSLDV